MHPMHDRFVAALDELAAAYEAAKFFRHDLSREEGGGDLNDPAFNDEEARSRAAERCYAALGAAIRLFDEFACETHETGGGAVVHKGVVYTPHFDRNYEIVGINRRHHVIFTEPSTPSGD